MKWGWLKKLAKIGPEVIKFVPPLAPYAALITGAIEAVEQLADKNPEITGAQKREIAKRLAVSIAKITNEVTGKNLIDENDIATEVGSAIDTVVGAVNLIDKAHPDD